MTKQELFRRHKHNGADEAPKHRTLCLSAQEWGVVQGFSIFARWSTARSCKCPGCVDLRGRCRAPPGAMQRGNAIAPPHMLFTALPLALAMGRYKLGLAKGADNNPMTPGRPDLNPLGAVVEEDTSGSLNEATPALFDDREESFEATWERVFDHVLQESKELLGELGLMIEEEATRDENDVRTLPLLLFATLAWRCALGCRLMFGL